MSGESLASAPARVNALDLALSFLREGILSVDSEGRIWRHAERTKLGVKPIDPPRRAENPSNKGYLRITLGIPGTRSTCTVQAHRVVWTWLHGPIPDDLQVNHKDLNKSNNHPDNLEIVTGSGDIRHSYDNGRPHPWHKATEWRPGRPRLSEDQKGEVLRLREQGLTAARIAKRLGISRTHVYRICDQKGGG